MFAVLLLLSACGGSKSHFPPAEAADTLEFRYAGLLQWIDYPDYSVVRIANPWNKREFLNSYLLLPQESLVPENLPRHIVPLRIPIKRALVTTAVHSHLFMELGALHTVTGVCDAGYILFPELHERMRSGCIVDVGNGMNPDVERMVEAAPDIVLLMPFENGGYGAWEKIGKPLLMCADYMESSPLGQAEWMRLYGRLLGCGEKADSLFTAVEQRYLQWKALAAGAEEKPALMCETKSGSAWYVPGGQSTMGQLYIDAGARYLFADISNSGSVPLAFEAVYDKCCDADVWLMKYNAPCDKSYRSLAQENSLYRSFAPFRKHNIWGCNLSRIPFYEETPFHPDLLLHDLLLIFHPDLLPAGDLLRYFAKMEKENE